MSLCTHLARLSAALLDFVYPPHCPGCEAWQAPDDRDPLCLDCRTALLTPMGPRCRRCGAPAGESASPPSCPNCVHWPATDFSRALVMADLNGPAQAAVHALKFSGIQEIGNLLGRCLATHPDLVADLQGLDLLVPVPLHPARYRERGFNQAEAIARGAAAVLGIPVRDDLVRRCRPTRQQAKLDAADRAANVADAFEPRPSSDSGGTRLTIGLVDDVITTGATLSACARALGRIAPGVRIQALAAASRFRRGGSPGPAPLT